MSSIKRSHSASPTAELASSPSTDRSTSPTISSAKKPKGSPKSESKKKSKGSETGSPKRIRVNWAPAEDLIILRLLKEIAAEHLWAKVKEDGRLTHRGSSGVNVHFQSMMTKIVKAQGQGGP